MTYPALAATACWIDAWQRAVLFWDALRERGHRFLEHERLGKPFVSGNCQGGWARTIEDVLALDDGREDARAFEAVAREPASRGPE
jgi:hypothetical protein